MRFQHFLLAMPLAFGLFACGSDDSSSATSDEPVDLSSASDVPPNPDVPGVSSASEGGDPNPNPDLNSSASGGTPSAVSLAPTANMASAKALYATWKSRWIITLQEEKAGGSTLNYAMYEDDLAKSTLTTTMGSQATTNPARVIWDGGNKNQCALEGLTTWKGGPITAALTNKIGCSVSEGIGYGMLIAYFHDDQELYNQLWAYNIIARGYNISKLMPWELLSFSSTVSTAAALDADLDVAASLILNVLGTVWPQNIP